MLWIIIGFALLLILLTVLLLFQLKVSIYYCYRQHDHFIVVDIYYIKIRVIHKKINISEYVDEEERIFNFIEKLMNQNEETRWKEILQEIPEFIKQTKHILLFLLKRVSIRELKWLTHLGTGEASTTGILTGGVWGVKSTIIGFLYTHTNFKSEPKLSVVPHFQQRGLYIEVNCIVSIRLGKAIQTLLELLRTYPTKEEVYI